MQVAGFGNLGGEPLLVGGVVFIGIENAGTPISCGDGWHTAETVALYTRKFAETFGQRTTETSAAGGCPQPLLAVGVQRVTTGLRLAVTVGSGPGAVVTYALWADELTVDTLTVGSKVVSGSYGGVFLIAPGISIDHFAVPLGASPPLANGAILHSATWNGESDPTMFDNFPLYQTTVGSGTPAWSYVTRPPLRYTVDVDVRDAGGTAPAGQVAAGQALLANPGQQTVTHWRWSEILQEYRIQAALSGDWSAGGVSLPAGDEVVPLRQIRPKTPGAAPQSWTPATFTIASPLDVLRSTNVFSGTGPVALSGTGNQTWTVSGGGASVSRILLEKWRNWNTFGDPDYHADDVFTTTKADYYGADGQDRWGWGLYAYLDVDLTAPANGNVTLTVTWAEAGGSAATAAKTYTIPATTGRSVYRVDLLFPNEGGPWYAERVDSLQFSGFATGVYQLHGLQLAADQNAYVKLHARGTYSGLVIAQDGSFLGHWGENPFIGAGPAREKDDESGLFSFDGGPEDTSAGGCVRMDGTLQDVAAEWGRMEGITTTYSGAAVDADLTDGTNTIPLTKAAAWYHTEMGLRAAKNVAKTLAASLYLDGGASICAAPAGTFALPFRHTIGMVLEAQAKDSVTGVRAGAGATAYARRSTTGAPTASDPLLGTGLTDAGGFVSVAIRDGKVGGLDYEAALLDS